MCKYNHVSQTVIAILLQDGKRFYALTSTVQDTAGHHRIVLRKNKNNLAHAVFKRVVWIVEQDTTGCSRTVQDS
jgi:hypothetical protein